MKNAILLSIGMLGMAVALVSTAVTSLDKDELIAKQAASIKQASEALERANVSVDGAIDAVRQCRAALDARQE